MSSYALSPDDTPTIELDIRTGVCTAPGCGGVVARHSLGGGQAVDRCTRCFRRYRLRAGSVVGSRKSFVRRALDEFVSWRE